MINSINKNQDALLKVSVITAVFNNVDEIQDAVDSVLSQRNVTIEYIVIDGGSTDGTLEVLHAYGDRITKLVSGPDLGIYDGLNRGIELATGDYIGFLHSDDMFNDEYALSRLFDSFSASDLHLWPSAVYGDLVYVDKNNSAKITRYWKSSKFSLDLLRLGWMPPHPTLYVRRDTFLSIGLFDIDLSISADYKFILNLFSKNLFYLYAPYVIVKMRTGGISNRSIKSIINKMQEDFNALRAMGFNPYSTLLIKNLSKLSQFMNWRWQKNIFRLRHFR